MLVECAGEAQLAVVEYVTRRGAEPGTVTGHALQMGRDDPGHDGLHLLVDVAVVETRFEGADEMIGAVAGNAEIDGARGRRVQPGELGRQGLVVGHALPEDERIADEEIGIGGSGNRRRHPCRGGIEMVGLAIDQLVAPGGGSDYFAIRLRPEAEDRVGRRPPLRNGTGHHPHVHRLGRQETGEQVERHEAQRQRRREQRAAAPAVATEQHDARHTQHGGGHAGPQGGAQRESDREDHQQKSA